MTLLLPLLPVFSAVVVAALGRRARAAGAAAVVALAATLGAAAWAAIAGTAVSFHWGGVLDLHLAVEGFGRVMALLVPAVAAPIVAYAAATEHEGRTRLLALMVAFTGAMELLVVAADFLTLLVAWEIVAALSWGLITHYWRDPERPPAALESFVTTRIGDLGLYVAAGVALAAGGTTEYSALAAVPRPALDWIAAGVLVACAAKSAQVPFSTWLFAAMAGPTPVSALLHSATLVAAGGYLLVRLSPLLAAAGWFLPAAVAIGMVTAIAGGVVASIQADAKRVLAASTSAHYGLIFIGIGAGSAAAGASHLVTHAFFKPLLFLGAGVAIHAAGSRDLARMGLGRALPAVAALSAVGAAALAGLAPLGGAWSKEQVLAAAAAASGWLGAGVLAAAFLSALYAARYQLLAFGPPNDGSEAAAREAGRVEKSSMGFLAAVTILLSALWLPGARGLLLRIVPGWLPEPAPAETAATLALVLVAFGAAWLLLKGGRLASLGLEQRATRPAAAWLGLPALQRALIVRPVLAAASSLRGLDDRAIDAGVRGVARLTRLASAFFSRRGEWSVDSVVHGVAAGAMRWAAGSRWGDERAVDRSVEGAAAGIGLAGARIRRVQTGLSHHYYTMMAAGLLVMTLVLALLA